MLNNHLKTHLAKSDGTTIREHIDDLFKQFNIFINHYPEVLTEKEKELLKVAIEYHDYGKLNKLFQCKLPANPKLKPVKCSKEKDDKIPHQYLSPLFLENLKDKFNLQELSIIIYSIINHHARGREYLNNVGIKLLIDEIGKNISNFFSHIGINSLTPQTANFYKKRFEYIIDNIGDIKKLNDKLKNNDNFVKSVIKISGLLIRIDHSASGEDLIIEEEPIKENREDLFLNYLEKNNKPRNLRDFQKKFKDRENLVLVADTGLGKTGLATLWSKRKMFYVLPNRTSTNAMFETMKQIFGKEKVGLLHSTSLFYIFANKDTEDFTILRDYDNTKNLSKPITISTADQLFTAVFKYPTYEKIYATLSYSDIVIDEIQGFDPSQIVPILKQIEETTKLGAKYLIITATLPQIIKEELEKLGFEIKTDDPLTIDNTKRHKIEILQKNIFDILDIIVEKAKNNKNVLVLTNTVSTAQEIYKNLDYKDKNLLHSRFIWEARRKKEEQIKNDYQTAKGKIWVSTQLVEASLDIDFDILFTEVAPADSLIQRMGRIWRHRKEDYTGEPNIYILSEVDEKKDIYEKVLRDESIKLIQQYLDKEGYLLSKEKRKIVEILYSRENLKRLNSEYFEKWKEVEKVLNSNWDYLFKKETQLIFRDTFSFEAIPCIFKDKVEDLINKYKELKNIQDKEEKRLKRIDILRQINDLKVPIPVYWVLNEKIKDKNPYEILDRDLDIYLLAKYFVYDDELGIRIDKEILGNYQFDEEIFI
ncbi:CRISPR-associated helicase/endonuclease Cas3 [Venenivibrio stagnispumantis]|uniref:CRISPR-associated endonuclease/helicase Cas3 n=1 Tax=Venenivibrio stagnispumantis TaxID=407998 RepID=A0AA45WNV3_9AQUI|nr:CRISPR-associated helicase Cas3' [Venenivibrio stagnispumantis]MCW4573824.1 CRISPR-associated helicase Cas3' [Venenivibrio stagnispumantis]SMP18965.1 CRISPR-associated endonuclease/helicase Cas3 [Venenivibrio stagnispumantis]